MYDVTELDEGRCLALLRAGLVGRVAACAPDGPHVVPVNYTVVDDAVVLRTTPYSLLGSHGPGAVLALEVDQFDYEQQRGWSICARGRAEAVLDAGDLEHVLRVQPPAPWAAGSRSLFLRLRWSELTGRRLGDGWDPLESLPAGRATYDASRLRP